MAETEMLVLIDLGKVKDGLVELLLPHVLDFACDDRHLSFVVLRERGRELTMTARQS